MISKHINTTYNNILKITPIERHHLLGFIMEDIEQKNKIIEKQNAEIRQRQQNNSPYIRR